MLKIHKGWHPLYARCVPDGQYIDNNTAVEGGEKGSGLSSMVGSCLELADLR